ncbi:Uu.00g121150.m01.CDS01 [Anthostomella pinea]|uniref:Uu.00g121150.m01.CDS01 n=1 Tax=Anthostomella pinea TaxID=933095 RepID=A0AAI8VHM6_9PEZI|nr:Uu.00g121150.m01.CDS01 [Anthostomella pinea]
MSSSQQSGGAAKPQPEQSAQLSPDLPSPTTYLTGHDESGTAIVHTVRPASWKPFEGGVMAFNQIYTTQFPPDLNDNADIQYHDDKITSGKLGLASKNGTVCRMVDFGPQYVCMMHRTQSLDFGIVVEGEVEMQLDDGSSTLMKRGDIAVQRATMHAWRNPSATNWARMVFVLQDTKPLIINGKRYGEDYGKGTEGLPPSGNDDD